MFLSKTATLYLDDSKLMQEDEEDTDRTHEANHEEENREEFTTHRIPIGELIAHHLFRNIPTQKQASNK